MSVHTCSKAPKTNIFVWKLCYDRIEDLQMKVQYCAEPLANSAVAMSDSDSDIEIVGESCDVHDLPADLAALLSVCNSHKLICSSKVVTAPSSGSSVSLDAFESMTEGEKKSLRLFGYKGGRRDGVLPGAAVLLQGTEHMPSAVSPRMSWLTVRNRSTMILVPFDLESACHALGNRLPCFLNVTAHAQDTAINSYIDLIRDKLPPDRAEKVHVFNTFFLTKLCGTCERQGGDKEISIDYLAVKRYEGSLNGHKHTQVMKLMFRRIYRCIPNVPLLNDACWSSELPQDCFCERPVALSKWDSHYLAGGPYEE